MRPRNRAKIHSIFRQNTLPTTPIGASKYGAFAVRWKFLYDRYAPAIEAIDNKGYPYRVRIFDRILWLIGQPAYGSGGTLQIWAAALARRSSTTNLRLRFSCDYFSLPSALIFESQFDSFESHPEIRHRIEGPTPELLCKPGDKADFIGLLFGRPARLNNLRHRHLGRCGVARKALALLCFGQVPPSFADDLFAKGSG